MKKERERGKRRNGRIEENHKDEGKGAEEMKRKTTEKKLRESPANRLTEEGPEKTNVLCKI